MLIQPMHAAMLAATLRSRGWVPMDELDGGTAGDRPRVAVPAYPASPGSRLSDPGVWQWWALVGEAGQDAAGAAGDADPDGLRRLFAVVLSDTFLAETILEHGPHWAPAIA
ncbi:MAG TPA: hypothetical protein VKA55_08670 [Gammaproteobacteria bacterium]|nr:hypothetical protein [Gammaproteobacteria bacterium]